MDRACSTNEGVLVGKTEGKRLLTKPRHKREDSIIMDLREI
jgi:hypothetical protein